MKTNQTSILVALALSLALLPISYFFGVNEGQQQSQLETQTKVQLDIAKRYFEVRGYPTEQWQQCESDYILYNDKSECLP